MIPLSFALGCVSEVPAEPHVALQVTPTLLHLSAAPGACATETVTFAATGALTLELVPPSTLCEGLDLPSGSLTMSGGVFETTVSYCPSAEVPPGDCALAWPVLWEGPSSASDVPVTVLVTAGEVDADGDGFVADDCGPDDPAVHPGGVEAPNAVDDDCDGVTDEGTAWSDDDGDGTSEWAGDCDDDDPLRHPGAEETADGEDDDCDGWVDQRTVLADDDGDGFSEAEGDCNDDNADVHPLAGEFGPPAWIPDGIDNDCDGLIDEEGT